MIIVKSSGEKVPFDPAKLRQSLERVGAGKPIIESILSRLEMDVTEGITTKRLYQRAFALLKELASPPLAAKYKVKNAIMELGPSGYSFEKYIARLLAYQGYDCEVGKQVPGQCVVHEIDVIGLNEKNIILAECKFHNRQGKKCDVKVPLYVHARFQDIKNMWNGKPEYSGRNFQWYIFTNTRFSDDAVEYARCAGINLVGWDYPPQGNLRERIHLSGNYPITSLTSLTGKEKRFLLEKEIVLCSDIIQREEVFRETGINRNRINKIIFEAKELCGT